MSQQRKTQGQLLENTVPDAFLRTSCGTVFLSLEQRLHRTLNLESSLPLEGEHGVRPYKNLGLLERFLLTPDF